MKNPTNDQRKNKVSDRMSRAPRLILKPDCKPKIIMNLDIIDSYKKKNKSKTSTSRSKKALIIDKFPGRGGHHALQQELLS